MILLSAFFFFEETFKVSEYKLKCTFYLFSCSIIPLLFIKLGFKKWTYITYLVKNKYPWCNVTNKYLLKQNKLIL